MPLVMPFVKEHLTSQQWEMRDAAVMALGTVTSQG